MTLGKIIRAIASASALYACSTSAGPAQAQFGGIVFDPSNYAQNVLTAARTLQQINNQIRMLQNQASSLINEAKNLQQLPLSIAQTLFDQIRQTQQLLQQAQGIAYDVHSIETAFKAQYTSIPLGVSQQTLVDQAQQRWQSSVGAFEDALKVQAGTVDNIEGARASLQSLLGASQSASGALQAAQAGNQLLALQSQQLADLTASLAAASRAQALDAADRAAAKAAARAQLQRFLAVRPSYSPGSGN